MLFKCNNLFNLHSTRIEVFIGVFSMHKSIVDLFLLTISLNIFNKQKRGDVLKSHFDSWDSPLCVKSINLLRKDVCSYRILNPSKSR